MSETFLQRVANGDLGAVQETIDAYSGLVWSLARRMTNSPTEAEDAVQEIFIAVWKNAERFDPDKGAEATFIAMIARRRLIDRRRRLEREQRLVREASEVLPAVSESSSSQRTDLGEEAARAQAALETLSADQQRVLQLAIHYGYTHEQIASITELPLGTVKTHARRGLIRIREKLRRETDAPDSSGASARSDA